jgi:hypothetical protein
VMYGDKKTALVGGDMVVIVTVALHRIDEA